MTRGKVIASVLNVRKGPGTQYEIIGHRKYGEILDWAVEKNGYYEIGLDKWVHKDWVSNLIPMKPHNEEMIRPVDARISQLWGERYAYYKKTFNVPGHNGVDYADSQGTPIVSIAGGTVRKDGYDPYGYGRWVEIYHPSLRLFSFYAHLHRIDVVSGQPVQQGAKVGLMGDTGNSTGPHLHFEIRLATWSDQPEHVKFPYYASPTDYGHRKGRVNPETVFRTLDRLPSQEKTNGG